MQKMKMKIEKMERNIDMTWNEGKQEMKWKKTSPKLKMKMAWNKMKKCYEKSEWASERTQDWMND